jgi:hypothetical protein
VEQASGGPDIETTNVYASSSTEHAQLADAHRSDNFLDITSDLSDMHVLHAVGSCACTSCISSVCIYDVEFANCVKCKGKKGLAWGHMTPLLLDLGASKHFTNNLNNFVEYKPYPKAQQKRLATANSTSTILGEGAVIIRVPDMNGNFCAIRIFGVCYVPDLNMRLLSLGMFLCDSMDVCRDDQRIVLERNKKVFMVFQP